MYDVSGGYSPRKINLASKLRGCIQRERSKMILALPTNNAIMETFEKTLKGAFSSINTHLSFDTELLMPNFTQSEFHKMKIDESFGAYKCDDLKVIFKIRCDGETTYKGRRVISKVLKLDENNQYGYAMTKPMPTGCIKEHPLSCSMLEFNLLLETIDLDDKIGHLYVVDIEFDKANAMKQQLFFNEIMPPIIEKQKIFEANKHSVYQLSDLIKKALDGMPETYCCTQKSHANMFPKKFIPLYLENLKFLITRCGWKVTKIYTHYTFEQVCFKWVFITMNQKYRQNAKNKIEKDFYKFMNNANFGFDCRNNLNNVKFVPIINEIIEISYVKNQKI